MERRQDVAFVLAPFDGEWEAVTCSILSPGCRAEAAGPSCCTLVTKIPYKSKWYTVRTTQGHDGLESLPFSFFFLLISHPSGRSPQQQQQHKKKKITFLFTNAFGCVLNLERHAIGDKTAVNSKMTEFQPFEAVEFTCQLISSKLQKLSDTFPPKRHF